MVGLLALDQSIGVRVPASQPIRRERSAPGLRLRRTGVRLARMRARPDA